MSVFEVVFIVVIVVALGFSCLAHYYLLTTPEPQRRSTAPYILNRVAVHLCRQQALLAALGENRAWSYAELAERAAVIQALTIVNSLRQVVIDESKWQDRSVIP